MCTYYHASTKEYSIGQSISINDYEGETTYDHECRTDEGKRINDLLDEARPQGVPSRKKCIYLFKTLEQCQFYATGLKIPDIRIYIVHSNDVIYGGYPFSLIDKIYRSKNGNRELLRVR